MLTGEEEPEDLIRPAPGFTYLPGVPRVGLRPPALQWGALNAGQAWILGSERMKGIEADDNAHFIACPQLTLDHEGLYRERTPSKVRAAPAASGDALE